jgi:hypothetical protein
MLEQQAGIQAKGAAEPRKSSNAGPYVDGDTSNRVRVFGAVNITPGRLGKTVASPRRDPLQVGRNIRVPEVE